MLSTPILTTTFIDRPNFLLSEQLPFRLYHVCRTRSSTPLFDMHYELELGIVLEGEIERYSSQTRYTCMAGDVWFCGMWELHGCAIHGTCEIIVLLMRPSVVAGLFFPEAPNVAWMAPFTNPLARRPVARDDQRDAIIAIGHRMSAFSGRTDWLGSIHIRLLLVELLVLLLADAPTSSFAPSLEQYTRISPALDLVFRSRSFITNDQAAECCAMSCFQFIREFQRLMGLSFATFALRHRLCGAADELARTDRTVGAVATAWGFSDSSHLIHLFLQHFGCSPTEYRRHKQHANS